MTTPLPPSDPSATAHELPGEVELSALYRQLPRPEPGPALDAAVLRAAAKSLENTDGRPQVEGRTAPRESSAWPNPKPLSATAANAVPPLGSAARSRRRRAPPWLIALGSAASLVLVAGLAWHMRDMPAPSTDSAAAEAAGATRAWAASTPPDSPNASQAEHSALASSPQGKSISAMQMKSGANHLSPTALAGLKPVAPGASAAAAPYQLSDKAIAQDDAAAINATRRAVREKRAASAPNQAGSPVQSRMAAAPAVMEAAPSAPPTSPARETDATTSHPGDTPQQELAKIQLLLQQHHEADARRRMQAFQRAHPQWNLPADLRGLLDEP
ncbi:MAG: hypothetical protein ABI178_11585 [Rhodanobacter sp.]